MTAVTTTVTTITDDYNTLLDYVIDSLDYLSWGIGSEEQVVVEDVLACHSELTVEEDTTRLYSVIDAALAAGILCRPHKGSNHISLSTVYTEMILPVFNVASDVDFQELADLLTAVISHVAAVKAVMVVTAAVKTKATAAVKTNSKPSLEETLTWLSVIDLMIKADHLEANDRLQVRTSAGVYSLHYGKTRGEMMTTMTVTASRRRRRC